MDVVQVVQTPITDGTASNPIVRTVSSVPVAKVAATRIGIVGACLARCFKVGRSSGGMVSGPGVRVLPPRWPSPDFQTNQSCGFPLAANPVRQVANDSCTIQNFGSSKGVVNTSIFWGTRCIAPTRFGFGKTRTFSLHVMQYVA